MADGDLTSGARVAVVGGGVSGSALALILVQMARLRASRLEVSLFHSPHTLKGEGAPAFFTAEVRSRLGALGLCAPADWRRREVALQGLEVSSGARAVLLPPPAGGLTVLEGALGEPSGQQLVAEALRHQARGLGVRGVLARVEQVQRAEPAGLGIASGDLVVRARGQAERFHAVALATGVGELHGARLFEGYHPPPVLHAIQARLRERAVRLGKPFARLLLNPSPGVDALFLVPCRGFTWARAVGPQVAVADLCQALMVAARDDKLDSGFELLNVSSSAVPAGAAPVVAARGQFAVGACALGHPYELGLLEALSSASWAASSLLGGERARGAPGRPYRRHMEDRREDVKAGTRAHTWLRRAGPAAARAFETAVAHPGLALPFTPAVLGLHALPPLRLLQAARWTALREKLASLFGRGGMRGEARSAPPLLPERNVVYVVDDDDDARAALGELLESRGVEVVSFADELSLFSAVAHRAPSAILLDVVLQWVDGLRLCEGLKRHPLTRGVPVYLMSGLLLPSVRERALAAGAAGFLDKPLKAADLWPVLDGADCLPLRAQRPLQPSSLLTTTSP